MYKNADANSRQIAEATLIPRTGNSCVVYFSMSMSANDFAFLDAARGCIQDTWFYTIRGSVEASASF